MSNYSSTPTMEEILSRIKTALAEREQRIHDEKFGNNSFRMNKEVEEYKQEQPLDYGNVYSKNQNSSSIDEKYNYTNVSTSQTSQEEVYLNEISVKPNLQQDDVFVLTKEMKVSEPKNFYDQVENKGISTKNKRVLHAIATSMANDLNMSFNASKIEAWLNQNFESIYKELE